MKNTNFRVFITAFLAFAVLRQMIAVAQDSTNDRNNELEAWQQAKSETPDSIEPYIALSNYYLQHDFHKALEICWKGLWWHPQECNLNRTAMYAHFLLEEHDIALAYYRFLSRTECTSFGILRHSLDAITKAMTEEQIIIFCRQYLDMNPNDGILHERIAHAYMSRREWKLAENHLLFLLEKRSHMPESLGEIYTQLGSCNFNLGEYRRALQFMTKAKEVGMDIPDRFISILEERLSGAPGAIP